MWSRPRSEPLLLCYHAAFVQRIGTALLVLGLLAVAGGWALSREGGNAAAGGLVVLGLALLAVRFQLHPKLRILSFAFWVFTMTCWALYYPAHFISWGSFQLATLITPLIQLIMLGMGATLSVADFSRALRMPRAVLAGMVLQFSVMPLLGWGIAASLDFPDEVAAGIVLIGSCSGGVASNVMAFLARGNVALSVTMTACSTMAAPLMTPLAMRLLAGRYIEIDFLDMMWAIVELIILPVGLGLVCNRLLASRKGILDRVLPTISMAGICFILAIIAAASRDELLASGAALVAAALVHNIAGYVFGYSAAGLCRLSETDRRTVAFEVGMQNGGMAVGLATNVLKSSAAALAPGIFGTLMNVTGSALASWWRGKTPVSDP